MHPQLHIARIKYNATFDDIGPFISGIIYEIVDSNWKLLMESVKPDLEVYMGDIIESFFIPIFDKIALEEFSDGQSDLEAYSHLSDSKNPSNSSSSSGSSVVVHQLTFSALACSVAIFSLVFL